MTFFYPLALVFLFSLKPPRSSASIQWQRCRRPRCSTIWCRISRTWPQDPAIYRSPTVAAPSLANAKPFTLWQDHARAGLAFLARRARKARNANDRVCQSNQENMSELLRLVGMAWLWGQWSASNPSWRAKSLAGQGSLHFFGQTVAEHLAKGFELGADVKVARPRRRRRNRPKKWSRQGLGGFGYATGLNEVHERSARNGFWFGQEPPMLRFLLRRNLCRNSYNQLVHALRSSFHSISLGLAKVGRPQKTNIAWYGVLTKSHVKTRPKS